MIYIFFKGSLFSFECGTGIYIIVCAIDQLKIEVSSFPIVILCIAGILSLCMLGFGIFLWILFGTHIYLILTNQTTAEYLKSSQEQHPRNPFGRWDNQDSFQQLKEVLQFEEEKKPHKPLDTLWCAGYFEWKEEHFW